MRKSTLCGAIIAAFSLALAACAPTAPAPAPAAKATDAPKPAAPTTGPAATSVPAAKPAEAPKPAAASATTAPAAAQKPATAAGPPVTIRFGGLGGSIDRALFVGQEQGFFAEQGITLDITEFRSAADMVPLLATGKLDAGHGSTNPGFFNAILTGVAVKVVSDVTLLRDPAQDSTIKNSLWVVIRKELAGQTKTMADLKGRSIAINNRGTMNHGQLEKILKDYNLTLDDIRLESVPFPDMVAALSNGAVDAVITVEPFISVLEARGVGVPFFDMGRGFPDYPVQYLFYGPELANQKVEVGQRFMVAYMKSLRWIEDAFRKNINRDRAVELFIKYTPQKDAKLYDAMGLSYNEPNGNTNTAAIETDQDFYVRQGLQKEKIDVTRLVDSKFSQYAVGVLGRY
jgi:NitT/TauT family transport system substrate-binding protein